MGSSAISYDEVLARLLEAENVIGALLSAQADAVVTNHGVQILRLHETDRALHAAKLSLERLLEDRTRSLIEANEKLLQEISDRKRAEGAFAASEQKFRALLESASEGVVAIDSSKRIVLVNACTEKMFGYRREELTGKSFDFLAPGILPEMDGAGGKDRAESSVLQAALPPREVEVCRKDGTVLPIQISLSFTEVGREPLALALILDLTERRRAESRQRDSQRLESLGLLAGGVAHDFNNLLTAILGNASLLAESVPPHASHYLKAVMGGAEKAAQITRQLLAYAGKGKFSITDLNLSTLVRENAELIRVSIPRGIEISLNLQENIPLIQADAGQIQQVLMNLVINASEAIGETASGTIAIATSEEDVPENIQSSLGSGRYVRVTVSDTGCGMDAAIQARIFDPFYTTKMYGRGLGLSAVRGILRSCGATIDVESEPDKGTTFTLLFPALEIDAGTAAAEAAGFTPAGRATILVVDDEDGVRALATAALERAGHHVLQASQGKEAVELVRSNPEIELVLLDINMPVMGGRAALDEIRVLRPNLPVVVSTGYGADESRRVMASAKEPIAFLPKPYTAQQLVRSIGSALA